MLDDIHILFALILRPTISKPFLYFEMEAQFDICFSPKLKERFY